MVRIGWFSSRACDLDDYGFLEEISFIQFTRYCRRYRQNENLANQRGGQRPTEPLSSIGLASCRETLAETGAAACAPRWRPEQLMDTGVASSDASQQSGELRRSDGHATVVDAEVRPSTAPPTSASSRAGGSGRCMSLRLSKGAGERSFGMSLVTDRLVMNAEFAIVSYIFPNSPASRAGIREGWIIPHLPTHIVAHGVLAWVVLLVGICRVGGGADRRLLRAWKERARSGPDVPRSAAGNWANASSPARWDQVSSR